MPEHIYIAGPMTGYPEYNFPAFFAAEEKLRRMGYNKIINPARHDLDVWGSIENIAALFEINRIDALRTCLKWDLDQICDRCNSIYLLQGWENSKGACIEKALAELFSFEILYETE